VQKILAILCPYATGGGRWRQQATTSASPTSPLIVNCTNFAMMVSSFNNSLGDCPVYSQDLQRKVDEIERVIVEEMSCTDSNIERLITFRDELNARINQSPEPTSGPTCPSTTTRGTRNRHFFFRSRRHGFF